jgi:hypothetical protein
MSKGTDRRLARHPAGGSGAKGNFDFRAKRRREIVVHAKYVGAAETDDFSRWLIAWVWHNPGAKDQIWSLMQCARNIGRNLTEAEADSITEEASVTRKHLSADNLARFLGVTYAVRQTLGLTTIGSADVGKRARRELRKRRHRLNSEARRRANGAIPRAEYEAKSVATQAEAGGVSRMTIYRRRKAAEQAKNPPDVTCASTPISLSGDDTPVTSDRKGPSKQGFALKKKEVVSRLPTATTLAADAHATLPLALRMAALCLPLPDEIRMAA